MTKYEEVFSKFKLNLDADVITQKTTEIIEKIGENNKPEILRFLYSCIDLTSLNTTDSRESIWDFIEKVNDFEGSSNIENVASVCVYPNFVQMVKESLTADVKIASVAGGFPSSQTFIEVKIAEVSLAVADGADEIDIVMNVGEFLDGNWEEVAEGIQEIKEACRDAQLKVILETELLSTLDVKKAAILSMYSGADFIKTSTGKGSLGADPESVYVMCEAIKEYYKLNNRRVGIKVAGGIKTVRQALQYFTIVKEVLGEDWLTPEYFRIGASSLAENLLKTIES